MTNPTIGVVARIGRWCYRRRGVTVAVWIIGLVALMGISGAVAVLSWFSTD